MMHYLKNTLHQRFIILLFTLLHFASMLLIVLGIFPASVIWLHLAVSVLFVLFAETFYAVVFIVINIPFFAALPTARFETLQLWRILLLEAGLVYLVRNWRGMLKGPYSFFSWDKYLGFFLLIVIASLAYARFPIIGAKQVFFWLNLSVLYALIVLSVKTKDQVIGLIEAGAASLVIFAFIGYTQLAVTFFTSLDTFWVYWASFVSKLYYGQSFASVLLYSNSWFAYSGKTVELRMFSLLPDSHSFASLMVYGIGFLLCLTYLYNRKVNAAPGEKNIHALDKNVTLIDKNNKILGQKVNYWLWSAVRFTGLSIVLSGTRALWVGLLVPFSLVSFAYYKHFVLPIAKKMFWPYVLIILFFILSPAINRGLQILQVNKFEENFISRAKSIYDLNDEANVSRLVIWGDSLSYALSHPFGTGAGNFVVSLNPHIPVGATYVQVSEAHNSRFNLPQKFVTAHNLFLHILVETGILGLAAFLAFWIRYFFAVERFVRAHKSHNNIFFFFVIQTAATFLWFLAAGLFDVTFFNDKVLFYFFLSLALSGVIMKHYDALIE